MPVLVSTITGTTDTSLSSPGLRFPVRYLRPVLPDFSSNPVPGDLWLNEDVFWRWMSFAVGLHPKPSAKPTLGFTRGEFAALCGFAYCYRTEALPDKPFTDRDPDCLKAVFDPVWYIQVHLEHVRFVVQHEGISMPFPFGPGALEVASLSSVSEATARKALSKARRFGLVR